MNTLLLLTLFGLIAVAAAQWDNNPNNNGQIPQFPNFPQIDCNAPGANCESKEVVCDGRGHCVEKSSKSGSIGVSSANLVILISCSFASMLKMYL